MASLISLEKYTSKSLNGLEKYILEQSNKPTLIHVGMYMCIHVRDQLWCVGQSKLGKF